MNVVELLEREQEKAEVPVLRSGDTVRVHVKVVEGTRERIQVFEGVVIALSGKTGIGATSFGDPTTIKSLEIWKLKPTNQGFLEAQKNRIWEPDTK